MDASKRFGLQEQGGGKVEISRWKQWVYKAVAGDEGLCRLAANLRRARLCSRTHHSSTAPPNGPPQEGATTKRETKAARLVPLLLPLAADRGLNWNSLPLLVQSTDCDALVLAQVQTHEHGNATPLPASGPALKKNHITTAKGQLKGEGGWDEFAPDQTLPFAAGKRVEREREQSHGEARWQLA